MSDMYIYVHHHHSNIGSTVSDDHCTNSQCWIHSAVFYGLDDYRESLEALFCILMKVKDFG